MVLHHVNEVRRSAAVDSAPDEFEWDLLRGSSLLIGNIVILDHLSKNAVARFDGAVHVGFGGGIVIRRANDAAEECRFAEAQIAHVFSEICLRRFAKTPNRKAAAIAQIDFIGVKLKNLLFREPVIDLDRHQHFFYLAAPFALGGKEEAARHLHIYRAGALGFLSHAQIGQSGANYAHPVESAVFEESL